MGTLVVDQFVSVDGVAEARDGGIDFFEQFVGLEETQADHLDAMRDVEAIVLGADTYRMFAKVWPKAEGPVAELINRVPKHVFSGNLTEAPWGDHAPAVVERDSVRRTIVDLKARLAGTIIVWGSIKLCATLFEDDLVDALWLRIVPVLAGVGRAITPPNLDLRKLSLSGSKVYPSGIIAASYAVR